jgi:protein-S-isoprenylcysteine O-methyltransferase Ste14
MVRWPAGADTPPDFSRGVDVPNEPEQKPLITNPLRRGHRRWTVVALVAASVLLLVTARPTPWSVALGLPVILAGVALRLWAAGHLLKTRELIASGPYAHTRNPLYLGTLLIGSGFALLAGSAAAAVAAPIGLGLFFFSYFPRKERKESALLESLYGDRYRAYHDAVPALLPRWRAWSPGDQTQDRTWRFARVRGNSELGSALAALLGICVLALHAL